MEKLLYTRKIQLIIDIHDQAKKELAMEAIYKWRHICFKAANLIHTHHYIQQQLKEMIYLEDGVKMKLADKKKDENGLLCTSRMNTSYQVLSQQFKGEIPMHIMSCLNSMLVRNFNKYQEEYARGEKTLPCFKKDLPIPFKGTDLKMLTSSNGERIFHFKLFDIPFRTYLGKDISDKGQLLLKLMNKEIKLCSSSLTIEKGKVFLLATFETQPQIYSLDQNIIAEASLSLDYPIRVNIGKAHYNIGSKDEYLYKRLSIQAAISRKQRATTFMNKKSRRQIQKSTIQNLRDAEKNYVNQKQHVYSKRLIDLCIQNRAATLLLVNQTEKEEQAKQDPFLLRNWGYYGLKEKIERKAQKAGISVFTE